MSEYQKMKQQMLGESLDLSYRNVIQLINSIPMPHEVRNFCVMNLDQGIFWAKQGIGMSKFPDPNAPSAPIPGAPLPDNKVNDASQDKVINDVDGGDQIGKVNDESEKAAA